VSGGSDAVLAEMAEVFARFRQRGEEASGVRAEEGGEEDAASKTPHAKSKEERIDDELRQQSGEANGDGGGESLSRRKQKQRDRLAISDLKLLVSKPEVVELHDANAADPKLLVYLKSYRNAVPVPMHWAQKRKYLQNKRGYEKQPFQLPECIENTGISKMRGAQQEKEKTQTNKQAQRAKMQPKVRTLSRIHAPHACSCDSALNCAPKEVMRSLLLAFAWLCFALRLLVFHRWVRSTSTTKSCTMPSSATRRSRP
jgi:splicing factor 3B subunit 2